MGPGRPFRRFLAASLAAAGLLLPLALAAQRFRKVAEIRSPYQLVMVVDRDDGIRRLILDGRLDGFDPIQSAMDLSDPDELVLPYTRTMMSALPLVESPKGILLVGLGGASMQKFLHGLFPEVLIETAEIDPVVHEVAVEYFYLKEDERQVVHIVDGRAFIEASKGSYDLIFLDAYSSDEIPYSLSTLEFLEAVKARLAPGAVVCVNLITSSEHYADMLKTYAEAFSELHLVRPSNSENAILVAFPERVGLTEKEWAGKAEAFESAHPTGLDLPRMIRRSLADAVRISDRAVVLRDKKDMRSAELSRTLGSSSAGRRTPALSRNEGRPDFHFSGVTTGSTICDACLPERNTRWTAAESGPFARKIFGTNVCGLRSMSGNQVLWTCTMIRCPFRKTWSAPGNLIV
jgi:spermidine synthase